MQVSQLFVRKTDSIKTVMNIIDCGSQGIAIMVDEDDRFATTLTDGDIRRAILAGTAVDSSINIAVANRGRELPVTAPFDTSPEECQQIMKDATIRHLPLLDSCGRVVDLATLPDTASPELPVEAVIMAGGFGDRLRPFTDDTPKPMIPVGGRPLMERTIERLRDSGISRINVTTHYLPEKIEQHFGNGQDLGVSLNYVSEDRPLGTVGALSLLSECETPLLVINGDILTRVDYNAFLLFHESHDAELTIGVRNFGLDVPYGVIEANQGKVVRLREKPTVEMLVNAGIYVVSPSVRELIPKGARYDMTDLVDVMLKENRHVVAFPILEYWIDIGQLNDLQQAEHDVTQMKWAA